MKWDTILLYLDCLARQVGAGNYTKPIKRNINVELESASGWLDKINVDASRKHATGSTTSDYVMKDTNVKTIMQKESKLVIVLL